MTIYEVTACVPPFVIRIEAPTDIDPAELDGWLTEEVEYALGTGLANIDVELESVEVVG